MELESRRVQTFSVSDTVLQVTSAGQNISHGRNVVFVDAVGDTSVVNLSSHCFISHPTLPPQQVCCGFDHSLALVDWATRKGAVAER